MRFSILVFLMMCSLCGYSQQAGMASENHTQPPLLMKRCVPGTRLGDGRMKKTKSSGVYYHRPEGAYYVGFGFDGLGYYQSVLYVCPWQDVTFRDSDAGHRGTWHTWTFSRNTNKGDFFADPSVVVGPDGDYVWKYAPGNDNNMYYTPTLTLGADSFFIGEENYFHTTTTNAYPGRIMAGSQVVIKAADDHQRYYYMGVSYGNSSSWGIIGDNMFGTGIVYDKYVSYGAAQVFDRPMSPLAVDKVFIHGNSYSRQPIPQGDTLVCYISKCTKRTLNSGAVISAPTYEYTDTLYAFAADTLGFVKTRLRNGVPIYEGDVLFSKKTIGEGGELRDAPLVVSPDVFDENGFAMVFVGFDKPNVDLGVFGYYFNDDEDDIEEGQMLFYDPDTGNEYIDIYGAGIAMQAGMVAMYDAVLVEDENGANVLRVSDDGLTCQTEDLPPLLGEPGVPVHTALPWFDENGTPNYELVGLPQWVREVEIDESERDVANHQCKGMVKFLCEPLSHDEPCRVASITIRGKGVESNVPIILLQGAVTMGLANQKPSCDKRDGKTYNMLGQRCGAGAKGILVRDGRKIVVR